jgi:hypothetical protein
MFDETNCDGLIVNIFDDLDGNILASEVAVDEHAFW